jgi:hypothetical protein
MVTIKRIPIWTLKKPKTLLRCSNGILLRYVGSFLMEFPKDYEFKVPGYDNKLILSNVGAGRDFEYPDPLLGIEAYTGENMKWYNSLPYDKVKELSDVLRYWLKVADEHKEV